MKRFGLTPENVARRARELVEGSGPSKARS